MRPGTAHPAGAGARGCRLRAPPPPRQVRGARPRGRGDCGRSAGQRRLAPFGEGRDAAPTAGPVLRPCPADRASAPLPRGLLLLWPGEREDVFRASFLRAPARLSRFSARAGEGCLPPCTAESRAEPGVGGRAGLGRRSAPRATAVPTGCVP